MRCGHDSTIQMGAGWSIADTVGSVIDAGAHVTARSVVAELGAGGRPWSRMPPCRRNSNSSGCGRAPPGRRSARSRAGSRASGCRLIIASRMALFWVWRSRSTRMMPSHCSPRIRGSVTKSGGESQMIRS